MRKYSKEDQKTMATWALDCAERVLPFFEKESPHDTRPRNAIEAGREWVSTGLFSMDTIRRASLDAHTAAKGVKHDSAAHLAARAAGQAVATAHVPQHAYGGAYYALRALAAANPTNQESAVKEELALESHNLPEHLRSEIMKRFVITVKNGNVKISLRKGSGF
jgi:hypothetical protein